MGKFVSVVPALVPSAREREGFRGCEGMDMDERVRRTIEEVEAFLRTVDDGMALPREAAEFVHALVLATGARRSVEIGTSYGYSGLWIAWALARRGGTLITIDLLERKTEAARANLADAGLLDFVEMRTGRALDILGGIDGPIDFVLNDADKENCIRYVELVADRLSEGAVVLTDNTTTHAEQLAPFLAWIHGRPDFRTAVLPVGNGMAMSVRCAATRARMDSQGRAG
jgi:predicted O-methyltransferase YrrM